jgi:hypothetical protein
MTEKSKKNDQAAEAVRREDDDELLGHVRQTGEGWQALTIFGYPIADVESREAAINIVREKGLALLMEAWEYLDPADDEWRSCLIREAGAERVTVLRAYYGYADPDYPDPIVLTDPATSLRK